VEKARISQVESFAGAPAPAPFIPQTVSSELDPLALRRALGNMPTGVTVVTAQGPDGRRAALTANSFASVSLEPPLVSVCVAAESTSLGTLRRAGTFAVHVLDGEQEDLARLFAESGPAKLSRLPVGRSEIGNPILERYLLLLECDTYAEYPGGDHRIILGHVRRCQLRPQAGSALTFFRGRFGVIDAGRGGAS
jgi:flavin reductase (DIM6/NTAB) family NADH-FMN oxidoreductase RutF